MTRSNVELSQWSCYWGISLAFAANGFQSNSISRSLWSSNNSAELSLSLSFAASIAPVEASGGSGASDVTNPGAAMLPSCRASATSSNSASAISRSRSLAARMLRAYRLASTLQSDLLSECGPARKNADAAGHVQRCNRKCRAFRMPHAVISMSCRHRRHLKREHWIAVAEAPRYRRTGAAEVRRRRSAVRAGLVSMA
jgi:hypothetical protein